MGKLLATRESGTLLSENNLGAHAAPAL